MQLQNIRFFVALAETERLARQPQPAGCRNLRFLPGFRHWNRNLASG